LKRPWCRKAGPLALALQMVGRGGNGGGRNLSWSIDAALASVLSGAGQREMENKDKQDDLGVHKKAGEGAARQGATYDNSVWTLVQGAATSLSHALPRPRLVR
jgi:hypothetical protein